VTWEFGWGLGFVNISGGFFHSPLLSLGYFLFLWFLVLFSLRRQRWIGYVPWGFRWGLVFVDISGVFLSFRIWVLISLLLLVSGSSRFLFLVALFVLFHGVEAPLIFIFIYFYNYFAIKKEEDKFVSKQLESRHCS